MGTLNRQASTGPPFPRAFQLFRLSESDATPQRLPRYPRISLQDQPKLLNFLEKEYCSQDVDVVVKRLWWMSTQDHANISSTPPSRQRTKYRRISRSEITSRLDPRSYFHQTVAKISYVACILETVLGSRWRSSVRTYPQGCSGLPEDLVLSHTV